MVLQAGTGSICPCCLGAGKWRWSSYLNQTSWRLLKQASGTAKQSWLSSSCKPRCLTLYILECHLLALALFTCSFLEAAALEDESSKQRAWMSVIIIALIIYIDHYIIFLIAIALKNLVYWQRPHSGRCAVKVSVKETGGAFTAEYIQGTVWRSALKNRKWFFQSMLLFGKVWIIIFSVSWFSKMFWSFLSLAKNQSSNQEGERHLTVKSLKQSWGNTTSTLKSNNDVSKLKNSENFLSGKQGML